MLKLKFYSDAGHGWMAVKMHVLQDLGIVERISPYSYVRGKTAYLEEDGDLSTLMTALQDKNILFSVTDKWCDRSPIRSYDRYNFNQVYMTLKG